LATNFPTSVDAFTNPTANDSLNTPSHATQHANANDAIEAIENAIIDPANYPDQLVNKTTATVRPLPFAMNAQLGTLTVAGSGQGDLVFTFPASRFTAAPIVTLGTDSSSTSVSHQYRITALTSSAATLRINNGTGGSLTYEVWMMAVQMTSAASAG
jgi:hypothetical protein